MELDIGPGAVELDARFGNGGAPVRRVVRRRGRAATYLVHDSYGLDTQDYEDHTFCGIMFDVACKRALPLDEVVVSSVWVRGDLGPMRVFSTAGTYEGNAETPSAWTLHFDATLPASMSQLVELALEPPIVLAAGSSCGIYLHSSSAGEGGAPESIVYNNRRLDVTHDDPFLRVLPGMAHTGQVPFSRHGFWGHAWRPHREFVGQISYGVKWLLWNPQVHRRFPAGFRAVVRLLLLIRGRPGTWLSFLPDEALLHMLNMCRWDWFCDDDASRWAEVQLAARASGDAAATSRGNGGCRMVRDRYGSLVSQSAMDGSQHDDSRSDFEDSGEDEDGDESG